MVWHPIWTVIAIILIVELFTHADDLAALRWRPIRLRITATPDCSQPINPGSLVTLTGSVANLPRGYTLQWWINEELRFQWPGTAAKISLMHLTETTDCAVVRIVHAQTGTMAAESDPILITWAQQPLKEEVHASRQ